MQQRIRTKAQFARRCRGRRTCDQAGSYLVKGLSSFIGDSGNAEVIIKAGQAYKK